MRAKLREVKPLIAMLMLIILELAIGLGNPGLMLIVTAIGAGVSLAIVESMPYKPDRMGNAAQNYAAYFLGCIYIGALASEVLAGVPAVAQLLPPGSVFFAWLFTMPMGGLAFGVFAEEPSKSRMSAKS